MVALFTKELPTFTFKKWVYEIGITSTQVRLEGIKALFFFLSIFVRLNFLGKVLMKYHLFYNIQKIIVLFFLSFDIFVILEFLSKFLTRHTLFS